MNTTRLRHLLPALLAAATLLTGSKSAAQSTAVTDPVGYHQIVIFGNAGASSEISESLFERASWAGKEAGLNPADLRSTLESMIGDLLASDRNLLVAVLAAMKGWDGEASLTKDPEFWSLSSSIAQELIFELVAVRTYGTSDYLRPATLKSARDPEVNSALLTILVRSLR